MGGEFFSWAIHLLSLPWKEYPLSATVTLGSYTVVGVKFVPGTIAHRSSIVGEVNFHSVQLFDFSSLSCPGVLPFITALNRFQNVSFKTYQHWQRKFILIVSFKLYDG